MKRFVLAAALGLSALAGCSSFDPLDPAISYSPQTTDAMLVHHLNNWHGLFERVDLASGKVLGGKIVTDADIEGGGYLSSATLLTYNGARATKEIQSDLGVKGGSGRVATPFGVRNLPPGDYALVGIAQPNSNGYGSWVAQRCFLEAATVFRLEPGTVNVFEVGNVMSARVDAGDAYDPALARKDEDRIKFYLSEYPGVTANVKLAKPAAFIEFSKPLPGKGYDYCMHGDSFRQVPKPPPAK